jgi:UDP-2,4-diacetamido-2,4,6-trideoxy-beta-L-altropyranose hydrolase
MKSVLFRTDATPAAGAGHLMRCIALGQEFQRQGAAVNFLTRTTFPWLADYLSQQPFQICPLQEIEPGGAEDLKLTLKEAKNSEWVVLDNYYFDGVYQKAVQDSGKRILLLDDLPEREFHADILLNHGMGADVLEYALPENMKLLLGSRYALIRKELRDHARNLKPKGFKNVLITLGGADHSEALQKCAQAFAHLGDLNLQVKVLAAHSKENQKAGFEICKPTVEVQQWYEWADLTLSAGGGTVSELCFFGIPGIVGTLAENQEPNAKSLAQKGIFDSVGHYDRVSASDLAAAIRRLVENPERTQEMRMKAKRLIDGQGAHRVYQAMQEVACEVH